MNDKNKMESTASASQKKEARENLKSFLLSSPAEAILYLVLGLFVQLGSNAKALLEYIGDEAGSVNESISRVVNQLDTFLSKNRLVEILFWAAVGVTMYLVIWLAKNVIINIHNDLTADKYVHPASFDRTRFWRRIISLKLFLGLGLVSFFAYIAALVYLLPKLSNLFYVSATSADWLSQLPSLLAVILITAVLIYLFVRLGMLVLNLGKSINAGF